MNKKKTIGFIVIVIALTAHILEQKANKSTYEAFKMDCISPRKMGLYEKYIKRGIDVVCGFSAIVMLSPLYLGLAALVKLNLGSPVFFVQKRPGLIGKNGKEKIFKMYKFRTMTDTKDAQGNLLPDKMRLTRFGKWLRSTSLDELPEAFNILNGTMSVIGPRPQLIRDITFMNSEQRRRHTAKPGLSGLAQVNGRNAISWEEKIDWDLEYIETVSFKKDVSILLQTIDKAFIRKEGITDNNMITAEDYGDYLLRTGKVSKKEYIRKQECAKEILASE